MVVTFNYVDNIIKELKSTSEADFQHIQINKLGVRESKRERGLAFT